MYYEFSRFYAKAINVLIDGNSGLEAFMLGDKENTHYVVGLTGKDYSIILDPNPEQSYRISGTVDDIVVGIDADEWGIPDELKPFIIEVAGSEASDEDYNLDSAGVYEYLKEIVDTKLGTKFRKKVWKEVENNPGEGKRYTRCLIVNIDDKSYIIDVTKDNPNEIFQQFDERELEKKESKIIPFKEMSREWDKDPYDGR